MQLQGTIAGGPASSGVKVDKKQVGKRTRKSRNTTDKMRKDALDALERFVLSLDPIRMIIFHVEHFIPDDFCYKSIISTCGRLFNVHNFLLYHSDVIYGGTGSGRAEMTHATLAMPFGTTTTRTCAPNTAHTPVVAGMWGLRQKF